MKEQRHRILCAVCALALVLTAVLAPAAWAADGAGEVQDTAKSTLTTDDAAEMQQADAAVTALTGSDEYEQMSREERLTAALAELDELARKGLVRRDSIRTDEENGIVSFTYRCGVLVNSSTMRGRLSRRTTCDKRRSSWRKRLNCSTGRCFSCTTALRRTARIWNSSMICSARCRRN